MLHLRLLGALDLGRDGEPIADVLVRPRAAGLLAYLATAARGAFARRDTLATMFWAEQDAEHGRTALRQQLHGLRGALGEGVLVTRGQEDVGLDPSQVTCDLWTFEDAVRDKEWERAAESYSGPFLAGFSVSGAPEFQRWSDETRDSLSRRYVELTRILGDAAVERSDHRSATHWFTLLLEADPYNTPAVIQLMKAVAAAGDRPNAVLIGDRYVAKIQQDLATAPSREFRKLHDALRLPSGPGVAGAASPHDGQPTYDGQPTDATAVVAEPPTEVPAQRIDRYRILRVLGEGGMGLVYEAEQTEPVWRRVALKVIRGEAHSKGLIARFEAERQALAVMDHPCIAKVLDAGTTAEGHPYFVMEFVPGTPLTSYCDDRRLPTTDRLALFLDVCGAIQHAHQKGVIHRDLKPSNVLVSERDGTPTPRVIDFGIAKARGLKLTDKTLATEYGAVVGTPAYMSPEQAEGAGIDVDTRTDIYSLGVMLYELLVGTLPIDPADLGVVPFIAQLALRDTNPPTPSDRVRRLNGDGAQVAARRRTEVAALAKELKGDLDWIVMKAIAPEREQRYPTAVALAQDLERYLHHEPVQARPPSRWYRARKFARRNRVGVIAGALGLLALIGGSIGSTLGFIQARRSARTATRSADFLASLLEFGDPSRTRGGNPTARDILDDGAKRLATDLANEPLIQARLSYVIGRANFYLGRRPTADTLLTQAIELTERHLGSNHLNLVPALTWLFYTRGQALDQEPLVLRALEISKRQPEPVRSGGLANAWIMLSQIRIWKGELSEAEAELKQAIGILETYPDPERRGSELADLIPRERLAHGLNQIGLIYESTYRFDDQIEVYRRSLALTERSLGATHPDAAIMLIAIAVIESSRGRVVEAESLARRAVAVRTIAEGPRGSQVLRYVGTLGHILFMAGRLSEAESLLTIAAEGTQGNRAAINYGSRAEVALASGRGRNAELHARRALDLTTKVTRQDSVAGVGYYALLVGEALVLQRQFRDAEGMLVRAAGIYTGRDSVAEEHPRALAGLAAVYGATGRPADAAAHFRRALALQEQNYRAVPALVTRRRDLLKTLDAYATFLRAAGRPDEARELEDRARVIRAAPG